MDRASEGRSSEYGLNMADWSQIYDHNRNHLGAIPHEEFVEQPLASLRQIASSRDTRNQHTKREE